MSRAQVRGYAGKAQEYLDAAEASLAEHRHIAATSLAVHAGISAADAIARQLARLLPLKTRAEYEPDDVPKAIATKAVRAAIQIVAIAQRVAATS